MTSSAVPSVEVAQRRLLEVLASYQRRCEQEHGAGTDGLGYLESQIALAGEAAAVAADGDPLVGDLFGAVRGLVAAVRADLMGEALADG
jgi:hypothetical protein